MTKFRCTEQRIIEANSKAEAIAIFKHRCTKYAVDCEEITNESSTSPSLLDPAYELYTITTQNVQTVAKEELDRLLTEDELGVVEHRLEDHIDLYQSIAHCIRDND